MAATKADNGDGKLVRAVLGGRTEAFGGLVERHFGLVYLIGYARLGHREAAEDLAQEVFLSAYLNLGRLDQPERFPAWLSQIARNRATDWLRRDQRASRVLQTLPLDDFGDDIVDERVKGAREIVEMNERQRAVQDAIGQLPPSKREMVLPHYVEGLSKAEIARRVAVHTSTVGRKLDRALVAMRNALVPILREVAPAMKAPPGAAARTTALIVAASTLPAANRKILAETVAGVGKLAAGSSGPSGGATGIGALFGSFKALLATAKGASAMSVKAKAATVLVAASLAAGSVLLSSQGDPKAQGTVQTAEPLEFPLTMKTVSPTERLGISDSKFPNLGWSGMKPLSMAKPRTIGAEPETLSVSPLYGTLEFGERKMGFRLDEIAGPGAGGEGYSPDWFKRFDRQGNAERIIPGFRILRDDGLEIASDFFLDQQSLHPYAWYIPKDLVGKKVRTVPVLDLGPLKATYKPLDLQL